MTLPPEAGAAAEAAIPEAVLVGAGPTEGRSLGQIAWIRLKRDKVALGGGMFLIFLILVAIFAPLIVKYLGSPPNEFHQELIDTAGGTLEPIGRFGGMSWDHLMGIEPVNGRDMFSRIVYGSRISLMIAFFATLLSVSSDHARRHRRVLRRLDRHADQPADGRLPRLPAAAVRARARRRLPDKAFGLPATRCGIATDLHHRVLHLAVHRPDHPRSDTVAAGTGVRRGVPQPWRALPLHHLREMLPNLLAPILVYSTLLIPTNMLFEAALSFLGVGIRPPTASWGGMLSDARRSSRSTRISCSSQAWRFSSPYWPSTCSVTGCATRSTHGRDRTSPSGRTPDRNKKGFRR